MVADAIEFVPFTAGHALSMRPQALQARDFEYGYLGAPSEVDWIEVARHSIVAFSAMRDGECIGVAGIYRTWPGRGAAWLLLSDQVKGAMMVAIHRRVSQVLAEAQIVHGLRRIELTVPTGAYVRTRWILMLGFTHEGTLRRYGPNGEDHEMFARITET